MQGCEDERLRGPSKLGSKDAKCKYVKIHGFQVRKISRNENARM